MTKELTSEQEQIKKQKKTKELIDKIEEIKRRYKDETQFSDIEKYDTVSVSGSLCGFDDFIDMVLEKVKRGDF
jgi:uncharacterized protein YacL (UPF0231 family)